MFLCLPVGPPSICPKRTLSGAVLGPPRQYFEDCVCRHPNCAGGGENNHETTDFSWHCMSHSLVLASKPLPCRHRNMASIRLESNSLASAARLRVG